MTGHAIDPTLAQRWVQAHPTPEIRQLAQFLVDHVQRVSQEEFEQALHESVARFNAAIGDEPYVVMTYGREEGSASWVLSLAREKGLHPPAAIVNSVNVQPWLLAHPRVSHVMVVDDAAYSGLELVAHLSGFLGEERDESADLKQRLHLHLLVPFMTTRAQAQLRIPRLTVHQYVTRTMPTIVEIFEAAGPGAEALMELFSHVYHQLWDREHMTLTYFQHKVPDRFSFLEAVASGMVFNEQGYATGLRLPFIPEVLPPYKPGYLEWARQQLGISSQREEQVSILTPALRAALDIAGAPPAERAGVVAAVKEHYGVPVAKSPDSLVPFLPIPQLVAVTARMEEQLRAFRAAARHG